TPTMMPTAGKPDYAATLQQATAQAGSRQMESLLDEDCSTDINSDYAIVAPPVSGPAEDFYVAIAQAHQSGSASPYPIYLCPGIFPMDQTAVLYADLYFYGRGAEATTLYQSNTVTMDRM